MQSSNFKENEPVIDASLDGKDALDITGDAGTGIDTSYLLALRPHAQPLCVICDVKLADNDGRRALPTCGDTCATVFEDAKNAFSTRSATNPRMPLCVLCRENPANNDGRRAFPTCGNTCAPVVDTNRNSYSAPVFNGHRPPTASSLLWRDQSTQTNAEMVEANPPPCKTCLIRQQEERIRKDRDFCSYASTMAVADQITPWLVECPHGHPAEICEFCKARLRDINPELTGENSAKCKSCLICWKKDRMNDETDYCSGACKAVADKMAPVLVEIPRGHAAFKSVSYHYTSEWKDTQKTCPRIKKVYRVVMKPDFSPKYERYRASVARPIFDSNGNEKQVWIGIRRQCVFGDSGNMEPCSSKLCLLCGLLRSSISRGVSEEGIMSTSSLARAVEVSSHLKRCSKIVLMANILLGREIEMTEDEVKYTSLPPQGYESVHLIEYEAWGGKVDIEELLVFDGDAIRPLYLITYE